MASIKSSFFFLDPALICFSRAIASSIVEGTSYQTNIFQPYRLVKPAIAPVRCNQARCGKFDVTPTTKQSSAAGSFWIASLRS
jgi:hypothetical protein